jgi:hypothetical protein
MEDSKTHERWLVLLLRFGGLLLLSAFVAVFLPTAWMERIHRLLGLGAFPSSPLVDYLTRSISALYGIHGGVLLVVSSDVRRHAPIVRYLGGINIVLGLLMLGIDLHAGMPAWWIWSEGPPVVVIGIALLYLIGKVEPA